MLELGDLVVGEVEDFEVGVGFEAVEGCYGVVRDVEFFEVLEGGEAG